MAGARVTVTVDEGHLARVHEIVAELRRRGMEVESVLEGLGMVTGTTEDPALLVDVDGVWSVDEDQSYQIGPPGAGIQGTPDADEDRPPTTGEEIR